jgi:hypothetical protein
MCSANFFYILPKRVKVVETMDEIDELRAARSRIRELETALADAHMDYCLESAFLDIACGKLGTSAEELKKKQRYNARQVAKGKWDSMKAAVTVGKLCGKLGMSRQKYYKARTERQRREADSGLIEQLVWAERAGTAASWGTEAVPYSGV